MMVGLFGMVSSDVLGVWVDVIFLDFEQILLSMGSCVSRYFMLYA